VSQRPSQIPHVTAEDRIESEEFAEKRTIPKSGPCSLFTFTRRYTRLQVFTADNMAQSLIPHNIPVMIDTKTKHVWTNPYRQEATVVEILLIHPFIFGSEQREHRSFCLTVICNGRH
jgi:hypothetical protein